MCLTDDSSTQIEHVVAANGQPNHGTWVYATISPTALAAARAPGRRAARSGAAPRVIAAITRSRRTGSCTRRSLTTRSFRTAGPTTRGRTASTADPTLSTISHELNETITDPQGNAWVDAEGDEAADLCLTSFGPAIGGQPTRAWNQSINGGHFYLQELWSNASHACEPRAKPDALSFAAVHDPARDRMVAFTARGSDPQGRLVSFNWAFGDGQAGVGRRVSHMYVLPGPYRVMLRATDNWGNWAYSGGRSASSRASPAPRPGRAPGAASGAVRPPRIGGGDLQVVAERPVEEAPGLHRGSAPASSRGATRGTNRWHRSIHANARACEALNRE